MAFLEKYSIYVNRIHRRAAIHYSTCNRLAQLGGVPSEPRKQYYITGLVDLDEATDLAKATGYKYQLCGWCDIETT